MLNLFRKMPRACLTHEECLGKVCAVCTNLHGQKASRKVSDAQIECIQKYIFSGYRKDSIYFPQGICNTCSRHLRELKQEKEQQELELETVPKDSIQQEGGTNQSKVKLLLPEDYHCSLPHDTRSRQGVTCSCILARMNGPQFLLWKQDMKRSMKDKPSITMMCQSCGRGIPATQKSHTCTSSDLQTVNSMLETIPIQLKPKLAEAMLREMKEDQSTTSGESSSISLPQARGAWPVQVKGVNIYSHTLIINIHP